MFDTLEFFSIFYFATLSLIVLGILFEDKLVKAEFRLREKYSKKRKERVKK